MTLVHSNYISTTTYSFTHSVVFACLWQKKIVSSLYIYIWAKSNEGRSVKSAYWLRRRQRREMNKENALFLSLLLSTFCYVSYFLILSFLYFCLHIAYRRSSSSTICFYKDTRSLYFASHPYKKKTSEINENKKSNLNAYSSTYYSLLHHQESLKKKQFVTVFFVALSKRRRKKCSSVNKWLNTHQEKRFVTFFFHHWWNTMNIFPQVDAEKEDKFMHI
jgi:hypothetical protein